MRTTGLYVHRDPLWERVPHPLSYYTVKRRTGAERAKKREGEKEGKKGEEKKEEKTPAPST